MSRILMVVLFLCLVYAGCGQVPVHRDTPEDSSTRILPKWLGTYTGTVVFTYGDIVDKRGGEGFPATLVLTPHKDVIVFELTTHHKPFSYFFFLPPSTFTASAIEFMRNAVHLGTEYQFRVTLFLSGNELNGTMKMYSLISNGSYTPRGSYFMSFTKQGP